MFSVRGRHGPQLTPALMALLEHADRAVLNGLLRLAGLDVPAGGEAAFHFPAPDGADGAGEIHLGDRRIWLAAVAPGEEPPPTAIFFGSAFHAATSWLMSL